MKTLVIDVGGTHVKLCVEGAKNPIQFDSGPRLTPGKMIREIKKRVVNWKFNRISIGIPAKIQSGRVASEPGNLGGGWMSYNFAKSLGKPVRIFNDAVLQALGAYDGGRMLFLGFGTGVGSVIASQSVLMPLELGDLILNRIKLSDRLGRKAYYKVGPKKWRKAVIKSALMLKDAFAADYVVLGGGKAGEGALDPLPRGLRAGGNEDAFIGGYRAWEQTIEPHDRAPSRAWRILH